MIDNKKFVMYTFRNILNAKEGLGMNKIMYSGKIHRATVTDANLHYEGSITIDKYLIEQANMLVYEKVHVVNINNGSRFETYIIEGEAHSGTVCVNGAASRLVQRGDKIIIIAYMSMSQELAKTLNPAVVKVDENNKIIIQSDSIQTEQLKEYAS